MPTTPNSLSASLTSSSLNGLITASIFFMGASESRGAHRLERLAVQRDVFAGRRVPGEVLGHGIAHQRLPERRLAIGGRRPAYGVEQPLDGVRIEGESGAGP